MAERRTIVIAGAGIGGLTAALALARAGFHVVVCERAPELSQLGAGIQLSPNAGRVLSGLGLDALLDEVAIEPAAIDVLSGRSGTLLTSLPGRRFRERYGFPWRVVHRADLQAILAEAISRRPEISIRLGATVGAVAPQARGHLVRIERTGGSDVTAAVAVIGADGVSSTTADRIPGHAEPKPTGRTAWRALIPADNAPPALGADRVSLWLGAGAHLVTYPVARGAAINIVAIVEEEWTRSGWSAAGDPAWLAARFAGWAPAARGIIDAPFSWQKFAILARDPAGPWTEGPYALLGDAAHAMPPFLAQGGAAAIEDAAVLARCLSTARETAEGLRAYEVERRPRAVALAKAAGQAGGVYHWSGFAAAVRDQALRLAGNWLVLRRNDWIYRWGGA